MIKKLSLKNFTVFEELNVDFSPKINVIIGENGTGKTHLLKAAYALAYGGEGRKDIATNITTKLVRLFLPLDDKLGKLHHHGANEHAAIQIAFASDETIAISFFNNSKTIDIKEDRNYEKYVQKPVFIPTKEVLSLIKGISFKDADKETVRNLFDDTYLDLTKLFLKESHADSEGIIDLDPRIGSVLPKLAEAIGGRYEFNNEEYTFKRGRYEEKKEKFRNKYRGIYSDKTETVFEPIKDSELSYNMTAEGFRKIGLLQQLLSNQVLTPKSSGPLLWDEPEANLNPKLMRLLVEILLELSRNGQQVILATHDYVLLKWFDLLMDKGKEDHVRFHVLYQLPDSQKICIDSTDNYQEVHPNAIADVFSNLTDHEISKSMGTLGK